MGTWAARPQEVSVVLELAAPGILSQGVEVGLPVCGTFPSTVKACENSVMNDGIYGTAADFGVSVPDVTTAHRGRGLQAIRWQLATIALTNFSGSAVVLTSFVLQR